MAVCGSRGWFFDAGDAADQKVLLREAGRLRASIQAAKKTGPEPVAFLHYPPVCGGQVCEEIFSVLREEGTAGAITAICTALGSAMRSRGKGRRPAKAHILRRAGLFARYLYADFLQKFSIYSRNSLAYTAGLCYTIIHCRKSK